MASEIKKCPFCGNKANLKSRVLSEAGELTPLFEAYVQCEYCEAIGKAFLSRKDPVEHENDTYEAMCAIAAWNKRP